VLIRLERGADCLHNGQADDPKKPIISCVIKIQTGFLKYASRQGAVEAYELSLDFGECKGTKKTEGKGLTRRTSRAVYRNF